MSSKIFDYVAYNTIQEMEKVVNFDVLIPTVLDMNAIEKMGVIAGKVVEICYSNNVVYRMAKSNEDISGDYTTYACTKEETIGEYKVTEKGTENLCFSAHWNDKANAFSIELPHGIIYASIKVLIESLKKTEQVCDGNPMVEYPYIFEAEYAVGFGVLIPTVLGTNSIEKIYVISKELVEIIYHNGIIYRTARGVRDISGDYTKYATQVSFTVGRYQVVAKGNVDLYYLITWNDGKMSWSIRVPHGIHHKNVEQLIQSLCQVNNACQFSPVGNRVTETDSVLNGVGVSAQNVCGAFSPFHTLNEEEKKEFSSLLPLLGVNYEPLLVSKNGSIGCCRYICNATAVTLHSKTSLVLVECNAPWTGKQPCSIQNLIS